MTLAGKVAVITGSSAGIGKAVALRFASAGAKVVVNSRQTGTEGRAITAQITEQGGSAIYCQADVTKEEEVALLFETVVKKYGTVDILVNNAGNPVAVPLSALDKKSWLAALDANLTSTVLCSIRAAKIMLEKKAGSIINTSSIRGIDHAGRSAILGYSAAKAGVNNFTRTLAKELAPHIFVNAIAPGFVRTGYMDRVSPEMQRAWLKEIPISRFIEPDELAEAYAFLAASKMMTGTIWVVDGGFTLKLA